MQLITRFVDGSFNSGLWIYSQVSGKKGTLLVSHLERVLIA